MEYVPTLLMILIIHFVSIGAGLLLIIGVFLRRKILMIPWLIIGEIIVAFWASMALVIIFLEGKLFQSGTSVFGLFTVLSLCLATMQAYFWILVQASLQIFQEFHHHLHLAFSSRIFWGIPISPGQLTDIRIWVSALLLSKLSNRYCKQIWL